MQAYCKRRLSVFPNVQDSTQSLQNILGEHYNICCLVMYHQKDLYIRVSVNIYVTMEDLYRLRNAVLDLMA